jgi:hypothetical protein
MYNLSGQIGGDADLSPRGKQYALKLPELVRNSVGVRPPFCAELQRSSVLTFLRTIAHSLSGLRLFVEPLQLLPIFLPTITNFNGRLLTNSTLEFVMVSPMLRSRRSTQRISLHVTTTNIITDIEAASHIVMS